MSGMVIDCFAGGGGASQGIEQALGRPCDVAVNHDPKAIAMHRANHPLTHHMTEDIFEADLKSLVGNNHVELMWASPDCTSHSRAKGGKPRESGLRMLPWAVHKHASELEPDIIIMENVAEIQKWGPLDEHGRPVKSEEGSEYLRFVDAMRELGYEFECRELVAADFGAPTTRKRWYAVLRSDGIPIRWPDQTHADGASLFYEPWRPASDCIDFTDVGTSIFDRPKPLAEATMKRIARGVKKFVLDDPRPFLVSIGYGERPGQKPRINSIDKPLGTIVAQGVKQYLCTPYLMKCFGGPNGKQVAGLKPDKPLGAITGVDHHALVTPFITKFYHNGVGQRCDTSMRTFTQSQGHFGLVSAFLTKYYGTGTGQRVDAPLGTVTAVDRFGLVSVKINGETYAIEDIFLRMLKPEELKIAQGFPESYIIDKYYDGTPVSTKQQVKMIGNSVVPVMAQRIVEANVRGEERI